MRNHSIYKKFKQKVADKGLDIEGVRMLDFNAAAVLLGKRSFSMAFLTNMKSLLIVEMQEQQDENDVQQLKQTAKAWLDANFPDWQAERGKESDKPFVKIWLEGKPEVANAYDIQ